MHSKCALENIVPLLCHPKQESTFGFCCSSVGITQNTNTACLCRWTSCLHEHAYPYVQWALNEMSCHHKVGVTIEYIQSAAQALMHDLGKAGALSCRLNGKHDDYDNIPQSAHVFQYYRVSCGDATDDTSTYTDAQQATNTNRNRCQWKRALVVYNYTLGAYWYSSTHPQEWQGTYSQCGNHGLNNTANGIECTEGMASIDMLIMVSPSCIHPATTCNQSSQNCVGDSLPGSHWIGSFRHFQT